MMTIITQVLRGRKTYGLLAFGAAAVLLNKFAGLQIPGIEVDPQNWLETLFLFGVGGTIRAGITKSGR